MQEIYLLLGANLGDPKSQVELAIGEIVKAIGPIIRKSSLYQSEAWGLTDQPPFINQIVVIGSTKTPHEILGITQSIEQKLGRVRKQKWGERIIDIDILYFGGHVINEEDLVIPHPFIPDRKFTLLPLVEIAASYLHPVLDLSNQQLLEMCTDNLNVNLYVHK